MKLRIYKRSIPIGGKRSTRGHFAGQTKQSVVCLDCRWKGNLGQTVGWNPKKKRPPRCPKCNSQMLTYV